MSAGPVVRASQFAVPVFLVRQGAGGRVSRVYGTAFPIGGQLFLSANHVVVNIETDAGELWVGRLDQSMEMRAGVVADRATVYCQWPEVDIAVIEVPGVRTRGLSWRKPRLALLDPVRTIGYPYAEDPVDHSLAVRAFYGYIVCSRERRDTATRHDIYELSFPAPRGLSGAPVFDEHGCVAGCIIANIRTEMLVLSERERLEEPGQERILERYEALTVGIAVQSGVILGLMLPDRSTVADVLTASGGSLHPAQ